MFKDYGIRELPSIVHVECRVVFGLALAPVLEAGSGDVRVAEQFLHLAMSASFKSALVAAVARIECRHSPLTSTLMPVSRPYCTTTF